MVDLHLICRHGPNHLVIDRQSRTFETGDWWVSDDMANAAIGGRIYLHEAQVDPAWHGRTVQEWKRADADQNRKIFKYVVDGDFRIRQLTGWAQEKAGVAR